jgi:primosomal protein N' (replication factor Y)
VVVLADPTLVPVQALVRWDPGGHAARELAERTQLALPPAARVASITGSPRAVQEALDALGRVPTAVVLGPVPAAARWTGPGRGSRGRDETGRDAPGEDAPAVRAVVRVDRTHGPALARALQAAQGIRSARKATDSVRIKVDPTDLG